jgi:hypothetical protein
VKLEQVMIVAKKIRFIPSALLLPNPVLAAVFCRDAKQKNMGHKVNLGEIFKLVEVNVFDVHKKEIVFSGGQTDAANFIGTSISNLSHSLRLKTVIKKQYAVRLKSVANGS